MFRQYRNIEHGEQFVVGGDCSQGGNDENYVQFLSKTKLDIPLVFQSRGVAAEMTAAVLPVLEAIHDMTGIKPTVAFERNNGGASEMKRLEVLNRANKYELYVMPKIGQAAELDREEDTTKLGWDTTPVSRPMMLGDLKYAINNRVIGIYDEETIDQLLAFIINRQGKPEAVKGKHDDAVMALAIAYQLFQHVPAVRPLSSVAAQSDEARYEKYDLFAGV